MPISLTPADTGLVSMECGQPLPICLPRAQGFDMGLVAVLEKPEHVATYAVHPAHLEYVLHLLTWRSQPVGITEMSSHTDTPYRVHKMREELCDDTLAYDLEF